MSDAKDTKVPDEHQVDRTGHWLSQDVRHHKEWLGKTIDHVDNNPDQELVPVLKEFKKMVEDDSRLYMLFNAMFDEIPQTKKYLMDPTGDAQVRDFDHMLDLLNHVLTTAPAWTDAGHSVGLVGVPINALLDWPMATTAGFAVFQDPKVNAMVKQVLDVWGEYLASPASASVLNDSKTGWFGKTGLESLMEVANLGKDKHTFEEFFICDPKAKHYGYTSWDDFFTRLPRFDKGIRPVASPDNDDVIVNACESKTYKTATNVAARQKFWLKGQPYSVEDMLGRDELASQFVGGTVYQAFLSALSYHRWHSPISGTIKKSYVLPGTYYSEPMHSDFFAAGDGDPAGEVNNQEYLTVMATRAIIFIEADNPKIGLMAFIGIGMTEVSTCDTTVKVGQHVKKGDELGMFHFGGSSWSGIWRKGVNLEGFPEPGAKYNVPVRSELCRVV